eukprot:CAMPEP_0197654832 /NCGR_PEP_ID=MMETSP1338-20131121/39084_1 /TAXON_ID=43686 ORGANISM="Pelagodinium beii, Strain RCC1491" /NCGR_SAMPLE_ID=MMETSP1338 /ASSEMBLY_ACC=CAM_ASM_000754 /LENGTH=427 /DNA_ID=CAMNT_0043230349 /DNA_START=31 /DNA_END=1314 /DNA_ORIENTATION=-
MARDEKDEDDRNQAEKDAFLQFRRQLDRQKEKHEADGSNADRLKSQGNHFFSFGLFEKAATMYSEALELKPESTVLLNNRAMAYLKQAMPLEALADADQSIELDKSVENIKAFWRRAQALLDLEKDVEAEEAANAGLALQASNSHLNSVRRKAREAITLRRLCGADWVGRLENGAEKRFSFTREGVMTMTVIGHPLKASFDLSVECNPQSMLVKMQAPGMVGSAPPPPVPYIYDFHDNDQELWICHPVGSTELPSSFSGPGFTRLRREAHVVVSIVDSAEPLDKRCASYMREFNQILPLVPPQLPERPSDDEISHEVALMDKVVKLKKRFGLEVHSRAMELVKAQRVEDAELAELAAGLRERLVARKVLSAAEVSTAPAPSTEVPASVPASDACCNTIEVPCQPLQQQPSGVSGCLSGLVARFCNRE